MNSLSVPDFNSTFAILLKITVSKLLISFLLFLFLECWTKLSFYAQLYREVSVLLTQSELAFPNWEGKIPIETQLCP